jgi:hypothetical protein
VKTGMTDDNGLRCTMSLRDVKENFELDLPPEHCQYRDAGCEFSKSCLNCPLPVCVYDEPGGRQKLLKKRRAAEILRLYTREGKSIQELAHIFNVSTRTVQRDLKKRIPA